MAAKKILFTKNYAMFHKSEGNRPLDVKKHKRLLESMKLYGFLQCFPIVVMKASDGKFVVKDGQHRLRFAELLGLTVYYIEDDTDFDVATINCAAKGWVLRDYAQKFSANGCDAYLHGLDFAEQHKLPMSVAFALLAGTTNFGNCHDDFISGTFEIKDRKWAEAVANLYGPLIAMSESVKNARCIEACMAVCRVQEFDAKRFLANALRCREKLISYSTRDAYLDMMESIYNFARKHLLGLKSLAIMAMRERSAITPKAAKHGKDTGETQL